MHMGNPMSYYIKALLDSAFTKDYQKSLVDIENAQQYTVGNRYLDQTANEFRSVIIDYNLFDPKRVIISVGDTNITDIYTEILSDATLFAMKSLVEVYSKVITQNVVIEAFKYNYEKSFALGDLLGSLIYQKPILKELI